MNFCEIICKKRQIIFQNYRPVTRCSRVRNETKMVKTLRLPYRTIVPYRIRSTAGPYLWVVFQDSPVTLYWPILRLQYTVPLCSPNPKFCNKNGSVIVRYSSAVSSLESIVFVLRVCKFISWSLFSFLFFPPSLNTDAK